MEITYSKYLVYRAVLNARPCFRQLTKWFLRIWLPGSHFQTLWSTLPPRTFLQFHNWSGFQATALEKVNQSVVDGHPRCIAACILAFISFYSLSWECKDHYLRNTELMVLGNNKYPMVLVCSPSGCWKASSCPAPNLLSKSDMDWGNSVHEFMTIKKRTHPLA